jgi:hypothetical protein
MNWKLWSRGLLAAVLNAVGNSFVIVIIDPTKFNLFQGGAKELATVMIVSGLFGAGLYLKEHPDPWGEFVMRSGGKR